MPTTLYWHDYETFGADPRNDRPSQFAGIRTNESLNEIGEPLAIYCKPAKDRLPHPVASLITGITPQLAEQRGQIEADFIARIHHELSQPGTCGVGYNSVRFDDEVTRHTLYRNFYEPYAREWQQGNSRWDIIDLARMTYALRPEGIHWPLNEDGQPSFRLELLTEANGLSHESAHDALSDVRATIDFARLLKTKQPRLYDWLFQLRLKRKAAEQLDVTTHTPIVHTSRMYPAAIGCTTLVMPLIVEPGNSNSILVYDLRHAPEPFLEMDTDTLSQYLFTRADELPEGQQRLPVKSVKTNKCPALAPRSTLNNTDTERIALDLAQCQRHWQTLCKHPNFFQRVAIAYTSHEFEPSGDVDSALYDGFIDNADAPIMAQIRRATAHDLAKIKFDFNDKRLPELLFRYRARNWPDSLSVDETKRWQQFCQNRLTQEHPNHLTLTAYNEQISQLRQEYPNDVKAQSILNELKNWGIQLQNDAQ